MPATTRPPTYRRRDLPQGPRAYVTLPDSATGRRRDVNLGVYGSKESREKYTRLLAEWESRNRTIKPAAKLSGISVAEITVAWFDTFKQRLSSSELWNFKSAIRVLNEMFGTTDAATFGPKSLRTVRDAMVSGRPEGPDGSKARAAWCRKVVNRAISRLRLVFRWAVAEELIPPTVYEGLRCVDGLRRGQTAARESSPVRPVADSIVESTVKHARPQVAAMIELQRLTGMRAAELTQMRTRDVDQSGPVWLYKPAKHKTENHGHARNIFIGPKGQDVLRPWLRLQLDEPIFQPAEAVESQLADRRKNHELYPKRRAENPKRRPGVRYTTDSYRRAIWRACDRAGVPRWSPHQLRHSFATEARKNFGIEVARAALGHSSVDVTEIYAEVDLTRARELAERIG